MYKIISKLFRRELYPEISKAGGFANAVNAAFESINSALRVGDNEYDKLPFEYCIVKHGNKSCQIYLADKEKLYMPDFWRDGVCFAHARTGNITEVAQVIDHWLNQDVSARELSNRFNFVQPTGKAQAFDENREVEFTWTLLAEEDDRAGLKEFIQLAKKHEVLSKLFPVMSLSTLFFSRCTGYPFDTADLPNVTSGERLYFPLAENTTGQYVVTMNRTEYIGQGNAAEVLKIVCDHLPEHIGPAKKGTADQEDV